MNLSLYISSTSWPICPYGTHDTGKDHTGTAALYRPFPVNLRLLLSIRNSLENPDTVLPLICCRVETQPTCFRCISDLRAVSCQSTPPGLAFLAESYMVQACSYLNHLVVRFWTKNSPLVHLFDSRQDVVRQRIVTSATSVYKGLNVSITNEFSSAPFHILGELISYISIGCTTNKETIVVDHLRWHRRRSPLYA